MVHETHMQNPAYLLIDDNRILDDCGNLKRAFKRVHKMNDIQEEPRQLLFGGMSDNNYEAQKNEYDVPSGLINEGTTCFLASATQALITIPSIRRLVQE